MFNFTEFTTADLANLAEALTASLRGDSGETNSVTLGLIAQARDSAAAEITARMAEITRFGSDANGTSTTETVTVDNPLSKAHTNHFLAIAEDSGNWSGCPWVDGQGNIGTVPARALAAMKRELLITVQRNEDGTSAMLTERGVALANSLGVDTVFEA